MTPDLRFLTIMAFLGLVFVALLAFAAAFGAGWLVASLFA